MKLATIALVACAASVPPPITNKLPPHLDDPPRLFAALLHEGRRWSFSGVTCAASSVHAIRHGWSFELRCGGGDDIGSFGHDTYIVTAAGMWLHDGDLDDAATLDPDDMVIPASPKPDSREHQMSPTQPDFVQTHWVKPFGGGWCFGDDTSTAGGDQAGSMLCIAAGVGVIGGSHYGAGGDERERAFGDVPPH